MCKRVLVASLVQFLWILSVTEVKGLAPPLRLGEKTQGGFKNNTSKDSAFASKSALALKKNFPDDIICRAYPGRWVKFEGTLPSQPVLGGEGPNKKVYIGMVAHESGYLTGTVDVDDGVLRVTYGGEVISVNSGEFYILTMPKRLRPIWKPQEGDVIPSKSVYGGLDGENNLYIARTFVGAEPVIGKLSPHLGYSHFPKGDEELAFPSAQILTVQ